jgi:predicted small integral membrane protein
MFSTNYLFRLSKAIAVCSIGLMATLIVVGNTTDYYTNYYFVQHVLKMDTTFSGSSIRYRSINYPFFYHAAYIFIIIAEAFMAFCCIKGSLLLFKNLKASASTFHAAKNWAVAGLLTGIIIWFLGFEVVGGEWFAMWQSNSWNGMASAEKIVNFLAGTLVLLHFKDGEWQTQSICFKKAEK